MKKTKLRVSLLALVMLFTSFTSVLVGAYVTQPKAQIVISSDVAQTGIKLSGKTFNVYKVLNATVLDDTGSDENPNDNIEYFVNDNYKDFFTGIGIVETDSFDHDVQMFINEAKAGIEDSTYIYNDITISDMQSLVAAIRAYSIANVDVTASTNPEVTTTNKIETVSTDALDPGYYLVLDSADTSTVASGTAAMAGALVTLPSRQTTGDVGALTANTVINLKASVPTINKEVWHNDIDNSDSDNSPTYGIGGSWDEVADYQIGDTIEFLITATLPKDISAYDNYEYIITDTLSDGLRLNADSIAIYDHHSLKNDPVPGKLNRTTVSGNGFVMDQFNIQAILDNYPTLEEFYIYYTATVTEDANLAYDYETNTVTLDYSNNPYDKSSYGKDEDTVFSFTFELDVTKTSGDGVTGLEGAVFALYEITPNDQATVKQIYLQEDTSASTNGVVIYHPAEGKASDVVTDGSNGAGTIITRNENNVVGKFNIIGLDDETQYKLVEIKAPENYNAAAPIVFEINAAYTKVDGIPVPTITVDGDITSKDVTIVNTSATLLPETGGIGTTIFMVAGGSIMLLAVVSLIVKSKKQVTK